MKARVCPACGSRQTSGYRPLCRPCYSSPVREEYRVPSKYNSRGHGIDVEEAGEPLEPTRALPGTPEKLAVLESRAGRGEGLFHPGDAREET